MMKQKETNITMSNLDNIKDHLSAFHNDGFYLPSQSISLTCDDDTEINDKNAIKFIKNIHVLDNIKNNNTTINVFINSGGGETDNAMAIYDAIRGCKKYVRIYVYGQASSSASIILQAGDERVISPNSFIMIHNGTVGYSEESWKTVENWQNYYKEVNDWMYKVYLDRIQEKNPQFHKNKLTSMMDCDTILNARKSITLGLADRLVERGE